MAVELSPGVVTSTGLAEAIAAKIRKVLVVQATIELVPAGNLPRSEYKSSLVKR